MSDKRKQQILDSLRAGNFIYRHWSGTNRSGYLRHSLSGVDRLRESEVRELEKEGVIRILRRGETDSYGHGGAYFSFRPFLLDENHP